MPIQSHAGLRQLVAQLGDLERRIRIQESAPRTSNAGITTGALTVVDPITGEALVRIGQLADGSSGLEQVDPTTGDTVHLAALALGPDPARVAPAETTSSTGFVDLTTAGPTLTVDVGSSGRCIVVLDATVTLSGGGARGAQMGFDLSGPTSLAP